MSGARVLARYLLPALALVLAALTPGFADARSLAEVTSSKLLRVVVYEDNKPFSFRQNGQMTGIDVEIARLFARALDAELQLMPRPARENIDADLSADAWPHEPGAEPPGDVIMHVPVDRDVAARNPEVLIGQPYFEERIALAYDPARLAGMPSFEMFRRERIAVESGTLADYFVTFAYEGALRPNIVHYAGIGDGVGRLKAGKVAGVLAVRSRLEAALYEAKATAAFAELALPGIAAPRWQVGLAVAEKSGDLADFLGQAIATLKASGALQAISARYGVGYTAPDAAMR